MDKYDELPLVDESVESEIKQESAEGDSDVRSIVIPIVEGSDAQHGALVPTGTPSALARQLAELPPTEQERFDKFLKIQELTRNRNIKVRDACEMVHISVPTYYSWVNSKRFASLLAPMIIEKTISGQNLILEKWNVVIANMLAIASGEIHDAKAGEQVRAAEFLVTLAGIEPVRPSEQDQTQDTVLSKLMKQVKGKVEINVGVVNIGAKDEPITEVEFSVVDG
jgi:hypothetical protein